MHRKQRKKIKRAVTVLFALFMIFGMIVWTLSPLFLY